MAGRRADGRRSVPSRAHAADRTSLSTPDHAADISRTCRRSRAVDREHVVCNGDPHRSIRRCPVDPDRAVTRAVPTRSDNRRRRRQRHQGWRLQRRADQSACEPTSRSRRIPAHTQPPHLIYGCWPPGQVRMPQTGRGADVQAVGDSVRSGVGSLRGGRDTRASRRPADRCRIWG